MKKKKNLCKLKRTLKISRKFKDQNRIKIKIMKLKKKLKNKKESQDLLK